ncbi:MAG: DUF2493 domain-containing protein, partial [Candidatus Altiarchaeales archaeon]|nr:DUF2493 domain-containing protein [Candidatus Altiarchaeales archaeon]
MQKLRRTIKPREMQGLQSDGIDENTKMTGVKVAVVGSRNYADKQRVVDFVNGLKEGTIVVSGGALGVDTWAVETAKARGLETIVIQPEFKQAGGPYKPEDYFRRNDRIVDESVFVAAFWDGKSKGTRYTMERARKQGKLVSEKWINKVIDRVRHN